MSTEDRDAEGRSPDPDEFEFDLDLEDALADDDDENGSDQGEDVEDEDDDGLDLLGDDDDIVVDDDDDESDDADGLVIGDIDAADDDGVVPGPPPWTVAGGSDFTSAADALDRWASGAGVASDPFVVALARGLRDRDGLTFWATVDLDAELPEPRGGLITLLRRIARMLLFVRNVAVFAPVGLTWLAISRVSPGFNDYVTEQAAVGGDANFLQYWSTAAEEAFQIQEIAWIGFLIIGGIVLATLVAGLINGFAATRLESAMKQRSEVLLRIRRVLHTTRQATPESLATSLAESLTELLESSRLIIDAARRLEQASIGVGELEPTFRSLNDQLEVFDQRLGSAIVGSVDRLNTAVAGLSALMEGSLKGMLTESVAGLDEVREQLHRTAASVEFGAQRLLEDLSALSPRRGATR